MEVEPSKTALMHFGSQAWRLARQEGQPKAATFNFLGFTHFVGRSRRGCFMVGRKTQRERMSKKLVAFGERLKKLRTQGGKAMMTYAKRHLRGHLAYYAVSGNSRCLRQYFYAASRLLFKWLNRRSQRRRVTWARFGPALRDWLPRIHIQHDLYPSRSDSDWEPDGVTHPVRFCEGGGTYRLTGIPAATLPFCLTAQGAGIKF